MKQILFFILLLFFATTNTIYSQNPFLDSLKIVVDTLPNSKQKVNLFITLSVQTYSGEEASKYGWKAVREAKILGDKLLIADAWMNLAGVFSVASNIDSFNIMTAQAEECYQALNDGWGLASIARMRGNLFSKFEQTEAAKKNFKKAIEYATQAKHDRIHINVLNDWGIFLRSIKDYESSIKKLKEALTIYEKTKQTDLATASRLQFNLGRTYQEIHQFNLALQHQKKAFEIRKKLNIAGGIAESQIQLLRMKQDIENYNQQTKKFQETIIDLGYPTALSMLDSLAIMAKKINHSGVWEMFYKISYEYNKRTGNYENALKYYEISDKLEDSLVLNRKNITALADLKLKYDNEVLQNNLLRSQIAESQSTNQFNILLFTLFAVLSLGILSTLFFRQRFEARRIALQLETQKVKDLENRQQLVAMNAMLEGQEKERSRIAKDLHDGLGNMLTSLKFQVASLSLDLGGQFSNLQGQTEEMIDEACSEVRKIAHNMMPIALKKLGLVQALEDLSEKNGAQYSYKIIFQTFGRTARLNENVEVMLYRITQEIFNNINKHAVASEIVVQMTYSDEWLNLTFEDNGQGFDMKKVMQKGGLGLHSIQSRTEYLMGECLIDSRLGIGTNISINIPINSKNLVK